MTEEPKSENADLVSPSPSVPQVSAAGPLWQQLLLSQAIAQNSASLSSGPGNDSFRQGKRQFDVSAHPAGQDVQLPGFRLQPSAFQSFSQQSAAQALLQLPYQSRSSAPNTSPNHLGGRSASAHLLQHAASADATSCGAGEDSGGNCMPGCGDASAACKRKRNLKQQELNKLAQQRYRCEHFDLHTTHPDLQVQISFGRSTEHLATVGSARRREMLSCDKFWRGKQHVWLSCWTITRSCRCAMYASFMIWL